MSEVLSLVGSGKNVYGVGQLNSDGDIVNGAFEGGMLLGAGCVAGATTQTQGYALILRKQDGGYMVCNVDMRGGSSTGNPATITVTTKDIPEPTS